MTGLRTWLRTLLGLVLKSLVKSMLLPEWVGVRRKNMERRDLRVLIPVSIRIKLKDLRKGRRNPVDFLFSWHYPLNLSNFALLIFSIN